MDLRRVLAGKAFIETAYYDGLISEWMLKNGDMDDISKRVVGGKANTPTPKKLTKAILGRVANRARAELGIRPMLDE